VDAKVFLTQRQKEEAEQHFGPHPSYVVIPHSVPTPPPAPPVERDPRLVVMMARLDQQKQPDHAIEAFARVVREVPDARLEIYGRGVLAPELRKQIRRLRLQDNVTLAGFTSDPGLAYRRAALSVLTSKYEGFGLTLVESFQHGCPAISYDLRYGPSDIIIDGVTGYLVPPEDTTALADRIVHALRHPELLARMSAAATERAAGFSEDGFVARWCALFDQLGRAVPPVGAGQRQGV
jgi:poly(glycerol-phosphate) alpha-glucosyltransferase